MSIVAPADANVLWFLPTDGDGHHLGTTIGARAVSLQYLRQIAQAADDLGYFGVLLPTGRSCEDFWVIASALAPFTERLRYLVAVRPGLQSPTVAARMTATLDRVSQGRLLINVVTGGDPTENKGDGIFLDHDERYEVTREFLAVYTALLAGEKVNVHGKHIRVEDGRLLFPPVQKPRPALYFGGSSEAAVDVAADTIDKYLTWGEPPAQVAEKIAPVAALAATRGRQWFGIRLHGSCAKPTRKHGRPPRTLLLTSATKPSPAPNRSLRAWIGRSKTHDAIARRTPRQARDQPQSLGRRRPGRGGAGTGLVGDPPTVAARIKEYIALGIDTFIMSGYPHLEEAYRFAELVFPLLSLRHARTADPASVNTGPFGETIANEQLPIRRQAAQS